MLARTLSVRSYRSFESFDLSLSPGITILVGPNAAGKTNLVEALQILTSGSSFRKPSPSDLVREGAESCSLSLNLEGEGRVIDTSCTVEAGKRAFRRNGKKCAAGDVRGVLPSVLFCPDDLDMVKRSAKVRRTALDAFGMQLSAQYARLVSDYEKVVEQRNSLLKDPYMDPALLWAWDESLVSCGSALLQHRVSLLNRMQQHFERAYREISGGEVPGLDYEDSVVPGEEGALIDISALGREELEELFARALAEKREEEHRRASTAVGPHRDEIVFSVEGRRARNFASQGQQRSLVLAWKVAEVSVCRDILGYSPLLLLDDVMSELDAQRRAAFLAFVEEEIQTVITTTNLGYFGEDVLARAKVVKMDAKDR